MSRDFEQLRRHLNPIGRESGRARDEVPGAARSAAVLMLFTEEDDPRLTFIQRALTMRKHPGQVAFPGGGVDPEDSGPEAAALRESQEEVGLRPELVNVLGQLPVSWIPVSSFDVTPVVGTWDGSQELSVVDPAEVASVFQLPVSLLVDPDIRVTARIPGGYLGPAWQLGELFLWGFTGQLVDQALDLADWNQDWDRHKVVDVPARFMRP